MDKDQAAEFLGVSKRTLQRLMSSGKIGVVYKPIKGGGEKATFDRAELKRFKESPKEPEAETTRNARIKPSIVPLNPVVSDKAEPSITTALALPFQDSAAIDALAAALLRAQGALVEPYTLSIKEAAKASGLSEGYLRKAIKEGRLRASKGKGKRGFTVSRLDLIRLAHE